MAKFVSVTFAIVFLVAGLAPINAQTAVQPASSGVSQQEFQHLKSETRQNRHKIDQAEKRMDGIQQTQVQEDTAIINDADRQNQQDQKLDHTAKVVQDLRSNTNRWLKVISVVLALAIIGGVIIVLRSRKGQSAMEQVLLPMNATGTEVRVYAEAKGKVGETLRYLFEIRDPDPDEPNNPDKRIVRAVVEGTVHHAGTGDEYYKFGEHRAIAAKRHTAAIKHYEDLQAERNLHLVSA